MPPAFVEFVVRSSAAATNPAPFSMARYPPPDTAMAIFGSSLAFFVMPLMYDVVSKPEIFALERKDSIGVTVLFLLSSSHFVSLLDREEADRILGLSEGQVTFAGA